jgi:DHA1 family multidrug resistance protein-like MFS transporter
VIGKRLLVLLACLFVVMIGFGITLPVLPFYVDRLGQAEGATRQAIVMHVTLLTAVYPLGQLVFAPIWGRWSDRVGRRPLLLMGIAGYVVAQTLFGLATSLWLLYFARIIGGILSSATLPVSAAYVADATTEGERSRGMAWMGTASSLGFVIGPAVGGMLAGRDIHFSTDSRHLLIDGFSLPFFAAAALGLLTLVAATWWLPESSPVRGRRAVVEARDGRPLLKSLLPLLGVALGAQMALAMFEATFALHAQAVLNYGPTQVGAIFVVCGLVMAVFQVGANSLLSGRVRPLHQIVIGLALMGISLAILMVPRALAAVLGVVALFALGMALIAPNLSALISTRAGIGRAGSALGTQNAATSLGQTIGPLVGGSLFVWQMDFPYLLGGGLLGALALVTWMKGIEQPARRSHEPH